MGEGAEAYCLKLSPRKRSHHVRREQSIPSRRNGLCRDPKMETM